MTSLTSTQIASVTSAIAGVVTDELMSKHTNFRIGGPARLYVACATAEEIMAAVHAAEAVEMPWVVFGGGSNLLVADAGFEGLVIQSALREVTVEGDQIRAGSGVITALVARRAADAGLTGFEWAIGVPGTIGGAVYGNAGCYGGEMKDVVASVDAYDVAHRERVTLANDACAFEYRGSRFKKERHLIFGCTLRLTPGDKIASKARMQQIVVTRKEKQPLDASSAGCAFKNYSFTDFAAIAQLQSIVDVPQGMIDAKHLSAGWLIEKAGLMGAVVGNVRVSEKHGNFLVQRDGATAADVRALMQYVKEVVREKFGVELEEEVQCIGF